MGAPTTVGNVDKIVQALPKGCRAIQMVTIILDYFSMTYPWVMLTPLPEQLQDLSFCYYCFALPFFYGPVGNPVQITYVLVTHR